MGLQDKEGWTVETLVSTADKQVFCQLSSLSKATLSVPLGLELLSFPSRPQPQIPFPKEFILITRFLCL